MRTGLERLGIFRYLEAMYGPDFWASQNRLHHLAHDEVQYQHRPPHKVCVLVRTWRSLHLTMEYSICAILVLVTVSLPHSARTSLQA